MKTLCYVALALHAVLVGLTCYLGAWGAAVANFTCLCWVSVALMYERDRK